MGFVDPAWPDIFISYAHVDDEPDPGVEIGWVSTLVRHLEKVLARRLGRPEAFKLWMHHQLAINVQVTPEIRTKVNHSAVLIIILSPGYLASPWCQAEMEWFLDKEVPSRKDNGSRVFVVEFDRVERPESLAGLLGTKFWVPVHLTNHTRSLGLPEPDPKREQDRPYYERVYDLGADVVAELKRLKGQGQSVSSAAVRPSLSFGIPTQVPKPAERRSAEGPYLAQSNPASPTAGLSGVLAAAATNGGPAVYLAEVTDDLDARRDEVRRYLLQMGLRVRPERDYPNDPVALAGLIKDDLKGASLFVQLLSEWPGKKPAGQACSLVALRNQCAQESKIRVMQWRSPSLELSQVANQEQRALLEAPTVIAADIEEFKGLVIERLREMAAPKPRSPKAVSGAGTFVFVNSEEADSALVKELRDLLTGRGIASWVPLTASAPEQVRKALELNLEECDGLILVYRNNAVWLSEQWIRYRKRAPCRNSALRAFGICDGPPALKEPLRLTIPGMHEIDCRDGNLAPNALDGFIQALEGQ
jgi:hypothetical protein